MMPDSVVDIKSGINRIGNIEIIMLGFLSCVSVFQFKIVNFTIKNPLQTGGMA
jgi:hypothetical protein